MRDNLPDMIPFMFAKFVATDYHEDSMAPFSHAGSVWSLLDDEIQEEEIQEEEAEHGAEACSQISSSSPPTVRNSSDSSSSSSDDKEFAEGEMRKLTKNLYNRTVSEK